MAAKTIKTGDSVVNVASVPQRSLFRYPGGKTWLVPYVRRWFESLSKKPKACVEPFAGGGIVGLTIAAEGLADKVCFAEKDRGVAAVWRTLIYGDATWLIKQILRFEMTRDNVIARLNATPRSECELAFQTILRNRVQRGGILAPGATLVRHGENGKGVASRWYPETLANRAEEIVAMRDRLEFVGQDGLEAIRSFRRSKSTAFFIDPPYTAGGKRAGSRLYTHNELDHDELFNQASKCAGPVMLTYDDASEVRNLARLHGFCIESVSMKNTHHAVMNELVILNKGTCLELRTPDDRAAYLRASLIHL